jgi:transcriptional regulator with XRE-family HTH domain
MNSRQLLLRLGLVIRHHREQLKVSQEAFADEHGINSRYYGTIERGAQNISVLNLARIATALGKTPSKLLAEAERLDLEHALKQPANPPRRGRPPGRKSGWR